jgi:DNA-directed RNA polymerase specialized sigma24 family protein
MRKDVSTSPTCLWALGELAGRPGWSPPFRYGWSGAEETFVPEPACRRTAPGPSDALLVEGACVGDDDFLEELCDRTWIGVFRSMAASVRDRCEAEELTHEVFARAIFTVAHARGVGTVFRDHLADIGSNLLGDRAVPRRGRREVARRGGPVVVLDAGERASAAATVARLDRPVRDVLGPRLIEGWTVDEVATRLGREPRRVGQVERAALVQLRPHLLAGVDR